MYKVRESENMMHQVVGGGYGGCLETPSGETQSHHCRQHYECQCYHFGGCYSYNLPPCSHTAPDSIKQPCKTATST